MYYPAPGFKERAVSLEQGIKQKVLRADGDVWRKMSCSRMGFFFSPFSGDDVATVAAGGPSSCFVPLCCVVEPPACEEDRPWRRQDKRSYKQRLVVQV
ncbi:uncharacterized protein LOC144209479 isoform X2 [Stigmatopora nigra]